MRRRARFWRGGARTLETGVSILTIEPTFQARSTTPRRIPISHELMHRSVEPRRRPWMAMLTLALAAMGSLGVLYPVSVAEAQQSKTSTTSSKKVAAKPAAKSAKPAAQAAAATPKQLADGKQVYATTCAACHQATGEGTAGVFPPLAGSEWVTGDEGKLARIVLQGVTGPMEVAGETYNGMMPPWGGTLKDADIAAVLTYVRNSWGNKAAPVTTARVAAIRAATSSRTTPWTAAELAAVK
jgi:mono/diheme cytochrome c family protein